MFQRTLNSTLSGLEGVLVYIDDILIPAENEEQALQRLKQVLQRLREAGLTLNLEKCQFFQTSIEYLGKEIMAGTVRPSHHKIDCVTKALPPKTVRQLRQFLGLASYFRRFVPNFATKVSPLYNLLKKDVDFDWSSDCQQAFQIIKDILTQRPVLKIYDPVAQTEVHTDASSVGLGAILLQKDEDGKLHPVAYYSRRTSPDESKYHSYDLETLAVVQALKHFRVYLLGIKFKLITDCSAVRATMTKKEINPRVARWWIYLQDYNFDIEYRPGRRVAHVDYLSRNPVCLAYEFTTSENLLECQLADEELSKIVGIFKRWWRRRRS